MRKIGIALIAVTLLGITSCKWFGSNTGTLPYNLTTADQYHLDTIGTEYVRYVSDDDSLTSETKTLKTKVVDEWSLNGSSWSTYEVLVGQDGNTGSYSVYYKTDDYLTGNDVESRDLNVQSWELNLEERLGVAPWSDQTIKEN